MRRSIHIRDRSVLQFRMQAGEGILGGAQPAASPRSPAYSPTGRAGSRTSPDYSPAHPAHSPVSEEQHATTTTHRRKNDPISDSPTPPIPPSLYASAQQHATPRRRRKNDRTSDSTIRASAQQHHAPPRRRRKNDTARDGLDEEEVWAQVDAFIDGLSEQGSMSDEQFSENSWSHEIYAEDSDCPEDSDDDGTFPPRQRRRMQ